MLRIKKILIRGLLVDGYQIPQTDIIRIVSKTEKRTIIEIIGVKALRKELLSGSNYF